MWVRIKVMVKVRVWVSLHRYIYIYIYIYIYCVTAAVLRVAASDDSVAAWGDTAIATTCARAVVGEGERSVGENGEGTFVYRRQRRDGQCE